MRKLSERIRMWPEGESREPTTLVGIAPRTVSLWAAEVAALEEQLLERQAECFVLGDELASARQWAKAWKQAAKDNKWAFDVTVSFQEDYKEWVFALQDERDSARQWARAWKQAAKGRTRSRLITRLLRQRDSAHRVARALYAVYREVRDFGNVPRMDAMCGNPKCEVGVCRTCRIALRVLAEEA